MINKLAYIIIFITFFISIINLILLFRLTNKVNSQQVNASETEGRRLQDSQNDKYNKEFAEHIERLLVIDRIFNDDTQNNENIELEQLIIIENLFKDEN